MKDLTGAKFYITDGLGIETIPVEGLESAVDFVWANRECDTYHILMDPDGSYSEDYDIKTTHECLSDLGFLTYDSDNNIYYWFNVSIHNENGYPVESPEDIMEMLNVNPVIGDIDYDDDDAPEPASCMDPDALVIYEDAGYFAKNFYDAVHRGENSAV